MSTSETTSTPIRVLPTVTEFNIDEIDDTTWQELELLIQWDRETSVNLPNHADSEAEPGLSAGRSLNLLNNQQGDAADTGGNFPCFEDQAELDYRTATDVKHPGGEGDRLPFLPPPPRPSPPRASSGTSGQSLPLPYRTQESNAHMVLQEEILRLREQIRAQNRLDRLYKYIDNSLQPWAVAVAESMQDWMKLFGTIRGERLVREPLEYDLGETDQQEGNGIKEMFSWSDRDGSK